MEVCFRRVGVGDLKRLNEIVNDQEVCRFLHIIPPVSMKSTLVAWVVSAVRDLFKKSRGLNLWYAVIVDGEVAGSVNLRLHPKNTKIHHVAGFGIVLAKEYWGLGVGKAAIDYIVREARRRKIRRVELTVSEGNRRARMLYESCGFKVEGVKRGDFKIGRKYANTLVMGMILK